MGNVNDSGFDIPEVQTGLSGNPALGAGTLTTSTPNSVAGLNHTHKLSITQYSEPAGVIKAYGGSSAPTGYLLCDGSAVSRTTYAALFTAISTNFGTGDGSTTFNVPDLRGRAPIGKGTHADVSTLGNNDGVAVASRTPNHTHTYGTIAHTHTVQKTGNPGGGTETGDFYITNGGDPATTFNTGSTGSASSPTGSNNGGYLVINYIIATG